MSPAFKPESASKVLLPLDVAALLAATISDIVDHHAAMAGIEMEIARLVAQRNMDDPYMRALFAPIRVRPSLGGG